MVTAYTKDGTELHCTSGLNNSLEFYYKSPYTHLEAPTNLRWDGKIAKWDSVKDATGYKVVLYSNKGVTIGSLVKTSKLEYDFSSAVQDGYYFIVIATADKHIDSESVSSPGYVPAKVVKELTLENFSWLVNGQVYTQNYPSANLKSDFPGTITKRVVKVNGKIFDEIDTSAGEKIEYMVYIKLNDGYVWNSAVNAWLDGKVEDEFFKTNGMADNERIFIWNHITEYTDKIKITEQSPETLEYVDGQDVKLYVKATGADSYQWTVADTNLRGGRVIKKIDGATSSEYIIKNADSSYDGKQYRCNVAYNDEIIETKTITLKMVDSIVEENKYKVEFDTNGGSKIEAQEILEKGKVLKPKAPTKEGYTFDGWYLDKDLTKAYNFSKEVTENIILYAKWIENEIEKPIEKPWAKASDWAVEELDKANELEIIPEIFNKQDLTKNITRKEFAHVVVKLYEELTGNILSNVANNPFTDTNDQEVLKAYIIGITNGTSDTTFDPDALITREQMATMMTRALTKAGINTKVDLEKVTKFSDDNEMHDWGKEAIYYMSNIEIIKGMGNGTFGVLGNATREQSLLISVRSDLYLKR